MALLGLTHQWAAKWTDCNKMGRWLFRDLASNAVALSVSYRKRCGESSERFRGSGAPQRRRSIVAYTSRSSMVGKMVLVKAHIY